MKLWSFLFADPKAVMQSSTVAAPNRAAACIIVQAETSIALFPAQRRPADGVILQYGGEKECASAAIVSVIARDGRKLIPDGVGGWIEAL